MKYLKKFKIFESFYSTEDDIKDYIDDIEDSLSVYLDKKSYDESYLRFKFIVTGKYKEEEILEKFNSFVDRIINLGEIKLKIIKTYSSDGYYCFTPSTKKGYDYIDIHEENGYVSKVYIHIKGGSKSLIEDIVKEYKNDPDSIKEEIESFDKNEFIHGLFKLYCWGSYDIDFKMLESFRSDKDEVLKIIDFDDVNIRHNLSDQFKIDITPIFLKYVYENSGLIFRIGVYDYYQVKNDDRLSGVSIAQKTDETLKELGINLKWKDIFVKE